MTSDSVSIYFPIRVIRVIRGQNPVAIALTAGFRFKEIRWFRSVSWDCTTGYVLGVPPGRDSDSQVFEVVSPGERDVDKVGPVVRPMGQSATAAPKVPPTGVDFFETSGGCAVLYPVSLPNAVQAMAKSRTRLNPCHRH